LQPLTTRCAHIVPCQTGKCNDFIPNYPTFFQTPIKAGFFADCKSAYSGSTPLPTSNQKHAETLVNTGVFVFLLFLRPFRPQPRTTPPAPLKRPFLSQFIPSQTGHRGRALGGKPSACAPALPPVSVRPSPAFDHVRRFCAPWAQPLAACPCVAASVCLSPATFGRERPESGLASRPSARPCPRPSATVGALWGQAVRMCASVAVGQRSRSAFDRSRRRPDRWKGKPSVCAPALPSASVAVGQRSTVASVRPFALSARSMEGRKPSACAPALPPVSVRPFAPSACNTVSRGAQDFFEWA